jgi:hypothetical protein
MPASNMKSANQPYQTYPVEQQNESRQKGISLNKSKAGQSKSNLMLDGDIPLMQILPLENGQLSNIIGQQSNVMVNSKQSLQNLGNIPLLNLNDDSNPAMSKAKKAKQKTTKR